MKLPVFPRPLARPVINHFDGAEFMLTAAADAAVGDEQLAHIVEICNQPLVYDLLFVRRFEGRPYAIDDARGFIEWGRRGWDEATHFLFFIMRGDGRLVGAADIKSGDLASAEIGYWMNGDVPGVMTNAVVELARIAREAGYRSLFARVREHNTRSARVLERAGFARNGTSTDETGTFDRFELHLAADEA